MAMIPPEHDACANCVYSWLLQSQVSALCRRYAPRPELVDREDNRATWPMVRASSWCGEYKRDPAK